MGDGRSYVSYINLLVTGVSYNSCTIHPLGPRMSHVLFIKPMSSSLSYVSCINLLVARAGPSYVPFFNHLWAREPRAPQTERVRHASVTRAIFSRDYKNQFYRKSVCHNTQDACVKRKSRVSRAMLTRQNQIKSDFIACRVRIAWKSREYDVGNKVFPNTVTVSTIRKNSILF